MRTRYFQTSKGLNLAADVAGEPGKPAVVLLHGGGQTRHSWDRAVRALAGRGYFVVAYDARGHGESDWSPAGDYSLRALVGDLDCVLSAIRGPAALVGASLGGMTGFYAIGSADRPQAAALVMVDIVINPARAGVERIQTFMKAHPGGFADVAEAAEAVAAYYPDRPRPKDPSGLLKNLRLKADGRYYWHWDPMVLGTAPSASAAAVAEQLASVSAGVRVPTLLIRGGRSDMVDADGVAAMRALVPHIEVAKVTRSGHMVAGDRNDAFNTVIFDFLGKHHPAH